MTVYGSQWFFSNITAMILTTILLLNYPTLIMEQIVPHRSTQRRLGGNHPFVWVSVCNDFSPLLPSDLDVVHKSVCVCVCESMCSILSQSISQRTVFSHVRGAEINGVITSDGSLWTSAHFFWFSLSVKRCCFCSCVSARCFTMIYLVMTHLLWDCCFSVGCQEKPPVSVVWQAWRMYLTFEHYLCRLVSLLGPSKIIAYIQLLFFLSHLISVIFLSIAAQRLLTFQCFDWYFICLVKKIGFKGNFWIFATVLRRNVVLIFFLQYGWPVLLHRPSTSCFLAILRWIHGCCIRSWAESLWH